MALNDKQVVFHKHLFAIGAKEKKYLQEEVNPNHESVGESPRMHAVYELIRRVAGPTRLS